MQAEKILNGRTPFGVYSQETFPSRRIKGSECLKSRCIHRDKIVHSLHDHREETATLEPA